MKYIKEYKKAHEYVIVNDDDPDLVPIQVPLPQPPDIRKIDGYGLPAKEQMFIRDEMPERLQEIQDDDAFESTEEIWDFLEENSEDYADEIEWIEKQCERRDNGYWCFINGTPTYIPGVHYFYLHGWELDTGFPEYRDRDRRFYIFAEFCHNDPLCFGFTYPKHRREGATSKTASWMVETISRLHRARGGIQSMTETHAKEGVFRDHIVAGWRTLPFYWQPIHDGSSNPASQLRFFAPARKIGGKSIRPKGKGSLNSTIDFKPSNVGAYDTYKLICYHGDEVGKTTEVDVNERHQVVKQCLTLGAGSRIVGMAIYTSTVGEMTKKGGANFKKLCDQSHYDHNDSRFKRNENGQTLSGLYNLFIPAYDGLDGFIDRYGNSIIENPTPEQQEWMKSRGNQNFTIGAKEYLRRVRRGFMDAENFDDLAEFIRQYPTKYRECFRGQAKNNNFNVKVLNDRIDELRYGDAMTVRGNFEWQNGVPDTKVVWKPSPNGKFEVSHNLTDQESNRFFMQDSIRFPGNSRLFVAGGDPYKFRVTKSGKKSLGGGAVFMKRNIMVDSETTDTHNWKTHRFACTYLNRPRTKEIFGEDMLKMCVYYGCEMFPEINVDFLWDYFEKRGYVGYLLHRFNRKTRKMDITPGAYTDTALIESIFQAWQTYIDKHGMREQHIQVLEQCLDIEDDMGDYDLFTAGGLCLVACEENLMQRQDEEVEYKLDDFVRTYKVS